jgi:hypothetical protein
VSQEWKLSKLQIQWLHIDSEVVKDPRWRNEHEGMGMGMKMEQMMSTVASNRIKVGGWAACDLAEILQYEVSQRHHRGIVGW